MGVFLAFVALVSWGVGDFLIQRSTRKFGDWLALFYICAFSTVVLFPFVFTELKAILFNPANLALLLLAGLALFFTALFDFEAFKLGKLSVIEPINALELPVAVALAAIILGERLSSWQLFFVIVIMVGIFLVSIRSFQYLKNMHLEKGVRFALMATVGMGTTNLLFGVGGRRIDPLMINWFANFFIAMVALGYLIFKVRLREIVDDWKMNKKLILSVSLIDNLAWVAFTYSMLYLPIAISTGISESYVALATILGLTINKEKLKRHQWVGLGICIAGAIILAFIVEF